MICSCIAFFHAYSCQMVIKYYIVFVLTLAFILPKINLGVATTVLTDSTRVPRCSHLWRLESNLRLAPWGRHPWRPHVRSLMVAGNTQVPRVPRHDAIHRRITSWGRSLRRLHVELTPPAFLLQSCVCVIYLSINIMIMNIIYNLC